MAQFSQVLSIQKLIDFSKNKAEESTVRAWSSSSNEASNRPINKQVLPIIMITTENQESIFLFF